jgi:surface polysaccharide O-acyltransferase-like enzyme
VSPLASKDAPRLPGLDALKGVAIVLVVLIHAAPSVPEAYRVHIVNGLARLAVPLFLVTTGFLVGLKQTPKSRLRDHFRRFLWLHLLYGAVYAALSVARGGPFDPGSVRAWLRPFGIAAWAGQFYLVVLVQVYFVAGYLLPAGAWPRVWTPVLSGVAAAAGVLALWLATTATGLASGPWLAGLLEHGVWLWFFYFALGAYLGARPDLAPAPRAGVAALLLGVVVVSVGILDLPSWGEPPLRPYARGSIFLGAALVALSLPAIAPRPPGRLLQRVGRDSFGIYVLNPTLLACLAASFGPVESLARSWLYAAAVVPAAIAATAMLRRFAPFALP